jgi:hypothetical protein
MILLTPSADFVDILDPVGVMLFDRLVIFATLFSLGATFLVLPDIHTPDIVAGGKKP